MRNRLHVVEESIWTPFPRGLQTKVSSYPWAAFDPYRLIIAVLDLAKVVPHIARAIRPKC